MEAQRIIDEIARDLETVRQGFRYDWTMGWQESREDAERRAGEGAASETYYTEGEGGWESIPETAEDARADALDYESRVMEGSREAGFLAREAISALGSGDLGNARECVQRAADLEREYGDCPTYRTILGLFDQLA